MQVFLAEPLYQAPRAEGDGVNASEGRWEDREEPSFLSKTPRSPSK